MVRIIFLETIQSVHQIDHGFETFVLLFYLIFIKGNSLNYSGYQDLIKSVLKEREDMMLKKRNLSINIDSRIAEIFKSSKMVASILKLSLTFIVSNGRSNHLLRKKLLRDKKEERNRAQIDQEIVLGTIPLMRREIEELKMSFMKRTCNWMTIEKTPIY